MDPPDLNTRFRENYVKLYRRKCGEKYNSLARNNNLINLRKFFRRGIMGKKMYSRKNCEITVEI